MAKNKINCNSKKKDNESRWICFFKSLLWPFIITLISCFLGVTHIYYINNVKNFENLFSTEKKDFFTKPGFFESNKKNNESTTGGSNYNCYKTSKIDKDIDISKYASFPYFLPDKDNEQTFVNWFSNIIFENTVVINKWLSGFYNDLNKKKDSAIKNFIILFLGGVISVGFLFLSGIVASIGGTLYNIFNTIKKYSNNIGWQIFAYIFLFLPVLIVIVPFSAVYYTLKYLFIALINPLIENPEMVIDIIKCNITPIAYLLTLIMVVSGWVHLSVIVAAIMTIIWSGMLISDLSKFVNLTLNKNKSN